MTVKQCVRCIAEVDGHYLYEVMEADYKGELQARPFRHVYPDGTVKHHEFESEFWQEVDR